MRRVHAHRVRLVFSEDQVDHCEGQLAADQAEGKDQSDSRDHSFFQILFPFFLMIQIWALVWARCNFGFFSWRILAGYGLVVTFEVNCIMDRDGWWVGIIFPGSYFRMRFYIMGKTYILSQDYWLGRGPLPWAASIRWFGWRQLCQNWWFRGSRGRQGCPWPCRRGRVCRGCGTGGRQRREGLNSWWRSGSSCRSGWSWRWPGAFA